MKKSSLPTNVHVWSYAKRQRHVFSKYFLHMKMTVLMVMLLAIQASARVYSQEMLSLHVQDIDIARALHLIEKKSSYRFLYNDAWLQNHPRVSLDVHQQSITEVVGQLLAGTGLTYTLVGDRLIVIAPQNMNIQEVRLTGVVRDSSGQPLAGVTVKLKGTNVGTITDAQGRFSLQVPDQQAVLVFSYVGYQPREIPVSQYAAGQELVVTLQQIASNLNELVVVGYGTQKKSVITGAISSVRSTELDDMPMSRIEQALQGRASGLTIAASSGQPGAPATVRVRGTTSINNSDPLYVVDGVPIDIGGIDYLNPNDIASIEVLKDAASAAIYGARAASGVILITTKKGSAGAMKVNYSGYYGTQSPARKLHLLDATAYATLRNESALAAGKGLVFPDPAALGKGTDWQSLIFNNHAKIQNHDLSISGGNQKSTYYASFDYYDQEGVVATPISEYKRFTVRFNSAHQINSWLKFGNNLGYSYIKSKGSLNTNSEFGGPLSSAINLDPITPAVITDPTVANSPPYSTYAQYIVRDPQGRPYGISSIVGQEMTNPLAYIQTQLGNYGWSHNIVGNVYAEITPIEGLTFRTSIGAKQAFWGNQSFTPTYYLSPTVSHLGGPELYRTQNQGLIWNWENTLSYTRQIHQHHITLLAGTSAQENTSTGLGVTYKGLPVNNYQDASMNFNLPEVTNGIANRPGYGYENQVYRLSSYFGRVVYDYAGRYLLTAILRVDGSSRFGSNNKYGKFPSASIGWIPSMESFWPENRIVSYLKIRGSYGVTGNDNIGDFQYVSTVSGGRNYPFGNDHIQVGYSPNAPANPDLKWEQTSQLNLGFDAVVWNDFNVTFDWYIKKTTGMLLQIQIPGYVGASGEPFGNVASLKDQGFELELGYHKRIGQVELQANGNASYVQNTITNIGDNSFFTAGTFQASAYEIARTAVGHPIASFYGFKILGIFQTQADVDNYVDPKTGGKIQPNARPGDFKWADLNHNGIIDDSDRTFIGNPTPDWTFGFTVSAKWKQFDVLVFGQGVAGNKIFQGLRRLDIPTANWTKAALGRWTGPGTSNSFPRLVDSDPNHNFTYPSTFYLSDGSYLRVKTIQIGYHLPARLIKRMGMDHLRVYVGANNLITFTRYSGYDPEIGGSSYSIDRGVYPQARSYVVGLDFGL